MAVLTDDTTIDQDAAKDGARDPANEAATLGRQVRAVRKQRGLTLDDLARASGLEKSYLSRIERLQKAPSLASILKIARALDVEVAHLFGEKLVEDSVVIARADDPARSPEGRGGVVPLVMGGEAGQGLGAFMLHPDADWEKNNEFFDHAGDEVLFVVTGRIELQFPDRTFVLDAGDCARFPGHLPHKLRRIGRKPASLLVVVNHT